MRLSFMSFLYPGLGCETIIGKAQRFGYHGIEWRAESGHQHGVELDTPIGRILEIRDTMDGAGLTSSCLATSVRFCSPDKAEREANLERVCRYVDLAAAVEAPCIRIFADPIPNTGRGARDESYRVQADYMARAAECAARSDVKLCMETHSVFRGFDAGEVLYRAGYPSALWINWHLEHCLIHGEDVDESYRHVKGRVAHAHFTPLPDEPGLSPYIQRQIELLGAEGFPGHFSVEAFPKDEASADALLARQVAAWRAIFSRE